MTVTWFEQGRERGVAQGVEIGQREALVILLQDRFGVLSLEVQQQVGRLSLDRIRDLLPRVPRAASLQELGLGGATSATEQDAGDMV